MLSLGASSLINLYMKKNCLRVLFILLFIYFFSLWKTESHYVASAVLELTM